VVPEGLEQREQNVVHHQHPVLCVAHHVRELLGVQAQIQGV